jgi:hypothetical protein
MRKIIIAAVIFTIATTAVAFKFSSNKATDDDTSPGLATMGRLSHFRAEPS